MLCTEAVRVIPKSEIFAYDQHIPALQIAMEDWRLVRVEESLSHHMSALQNNQNCGNQTPHSMHHRHQSRHKSRHSKKSAVYKYLQKHSPDYCSIHSIEYAGAPACSSAPFSSSTGAIATSLPSADSSAPLMAAARRFSDFLPALPSSSVASLSPLLSSCSKGGTESEEMFCSVDAMGAAEESAA
jgi:hypothetical protein